MPLVDLFVKNLKVFFFFKFCKTATVDDEEHLSHTWFQVLLCKQLGCRHCCDADNERNRITRVSLMLCRSRGPPLAGCHLETQTKTKPGNCSVATEAPGGALQEDGGERSGEPWRPHRDGRAGVGASQRLGHWEEP